MAAVLLVLLAGGVMVLAGYDAAAWRGWVAPILVPIGGLGIMAAFVLELDAGLHRT